LALLGVAAEAKHHHHHRNIGVRFLQTGARFIPPQYFSETEGETQVA